MEELKLNSTYVTFGGRPVTIVRYSESWGPRRPAAEGDDGFARHRSGPAMGKLISLDVDSATNDLDIDLENYSAIPVVPGRVIAEGRVTAEDRVIAEEKEERLEIGKTYTTLDRRRVTINRYSNDWRRSHPAAIGSDGYARYSGGPLIGRLISTNEKSPPSPRDFDMGIPTLKDVPTGTSHAPDPASIPYKDPNKDLKKTDSIVKKTSPQLTLF